MAVEQLPGRVRRFARYLTDLLTHLDQEGGWCGVFWQRDPDGMRACLDGREVPPWDVMEALLQDFAGRYGAPAATAETDRARALHAAALTAYDSLPGARDALGDRLDVMLREQRYAADRQAELGRLLASATDRQAADALRLDLAWARDDHARATARCAEIRARTAELDRRTEAVRPGEAEDGTAIRAGVPEELAGHAGEGHARGAAGPLRGVAGVEGEGRERGAAGVEGEGRERGAAGVAGEGRERRVSGPVRGAAGSEGEGRVRGASGRVRGAAGAEGAASRGRRRGGARFAGAFDEDAVPASVAPDGVPSPLAAPAGARTPRGARFAGTAGNAQTAEQPAPPPEPPSSAADGAVAGRLVEALTRLRAEGRSGEAHALLAEAAHGPAARFPLLAARLEQAGLGADWTTLLWETASLPAESLVAAADALAVAGRGADGEMILRQGVARPAAEIGAAVLGLVAAGRHREGRALLDACVRARTPEEAARSAEPAPPVLVPLLLAAAHEVSDERHWDLVHALRVAGFAT
ncbi:hypothetical protein KBY55_17930 [Streptomyces sp. b94]|uniref:hypothetical protein n=1 Tax=Streptomyces sp. b94 TaxID=1827634 RepID=UPI001B38CE62|nr:hypothetical protein [Streptomyces sp. b94]MBQ1097914.1 hypothetical protein [Streptomyces sp. b94]